MRARAIAAAGVSILLVAGSAAGHTAASNRQAAHRDAGSLLGRLELPPGTAQSTGEPAGGGSVLAGLALRPATTALVDQHRWWRVPDTMSEVLAFIESHPPQGGTPSSTGSSGQDGETTDEFIVFSWPAVRGVLFARQLVVVVAPLPGGSAGVRADAEVEWTVPRPMSERVPLAAAVLTVKRTSFPGEPPPISLTVTDTAKTREIARMLNRLQIVQPELIACPAIIAGPTVTLTFFAASGGPPLVRASMLANGPDGECSPISFSVGGQQRKPLLAHPAFLRRVGQILGVTLST